MQPPTAIPFLQPMITKAEYKANTTEKVKSYLEMSSSELFREMKTYFGERSEQKSRNKFKKLKK